MMHYQILPGASGDWHLYELTQNGARFVGSYWTENDALEDAKRRGLVK